MYGDRQSGVRAVRFKNVTKDKPTDFRTAGVFMAIGHQPNTAIFQGQLEMDELGYLKVKPGSTYTNVAGVFAAGDVADKVYRQAVTAAGTGRMAAFGARPRLEARPRWQPHTPLAGTPSPNWAPTNSDSTDLRRPQRTSTT